MLADIASVVSAVSAFAAVVMSYRNSQKIHAVHVDINSRMTQLLAVAGTAAHAEGFNEGIKQASEKVP
jgi:hypothetical protein